MMKLTMKRFFRFAFAGFAALSVLAMYLVALNAGTEAEMLLAVIPAVTGLTAGVLVGKLEDLCQCLKAVPCHSCG